MFRAYDVGGIYLSGKTPPGFDRLKSPFKCSVELLTTNEILAIHFNAAACITLT